MTLHIRQLNPFLVNPIPARLVVTGEPIGLTHAVRTRSGLLLTIEYADSKYGQALLSEITVEASERARLDELCERAV